MNGQQKPLTTIGYLTQSDIACNRKEKNTLFVKYKRKPSFIIEFAHNYPSCKKFANLIFFYYACIIPEIDIKSKKNYIQINISAFI